MEVLLKVVNMFQIEGEVISIEPYGNGHINITYLLVTSKKRYILQKINNTLFKDVSKLMNNIYLVTEHLKMKSDKEVLTLVKTINDEIYLNLYDDYYRMYYFIENSVCLQIPRNTEEFYESAISFGEFTNMLTDFEAIKLFEVLPDFHNTVKRFYNF